jgi:hypothetical protein
MRFTTKARVGGRSVLDGDGEGLADALPGVGEAGPEDEVAVPLLLVAPPGEAVRTGSSSSRVTSHQPPTSRTATAPAATRTQKPVSGSGVPVPGWV